MGFPILVKRHIHIESRTWTESQYKDVLSVPIIKIAPSHDRLIFIIWLLSQEGLGSIVLGNKGDDFIRCIKWHEESIFHWDKTVPILWVSSLTKTMPRYTTLRWRHNERDSVSNHQPHGCLLDGLLRRRSKKTSKLRVTGLCVGNSPKPVNSPHKGPVTQKMFPFDDVIMKKTSPGASGLPRQIYL